VVCRGALLEEGELLRHPISTATPKLNVFVLLHIRSTCPTYCIFFPLWFALLRHLFCCDVGRRSTHWAFTLSW
jgi:hypothetical protein